MCSSPGKPPRWPLPVSWFWLWAGACTAAFTRAAGVRVPLNTPCWRTPQLAEHVMRLKLNPPETLAAAKAQATARLAQLNRRHALDADIARRPAPADCGLDAVSLGLLNDAVRSGNDATRTAASGMPGGVPTGAGTD